MRCGSKRSWVLSGAALNHRERADGSFPPRFSKSTLWVLLLGVSLWFPACSRQDSSNSSADAPGPANPRAASRFPKLQAELDSFHQVPLERDPAKRPVVLSERKANRRDWSLGALERGYTKGTATGKRWDSQMRAACKAYADYSRGNSTPENYAALTNAVVAAAAAGCRDPLLQYMQVRYELVDTSASPDAYALAVLHAFRAMLGTPHHPAFKFIVGLRAIGASRVPEIRADPRGITDLVRAAMEDFARDTNAPPEEVLDSAVMWLEASRAKGWTDYALSHLQEILERNCGSHEAYFRLQGLAAYKRAWEERGTGFANTVKQAGWEGFQTQLELAQVALEKSWEMNPSNAYTAYLMMQVELGQGQGRDRMEQWFERAMTFATNYYDAAKLMSFYLEPRWHGSAEEALEFARSCVASTNWGGTVPLVLPDVHHSLANYRKLKDAPEYWHRPEVWDDVRSAYERFFALNPSEVGYRHNYARDAYLCGHYEEFLAQAKLFQGTNYEYFGGEDQFRLMLKRASEGR